MRGGGAERLHRRVRASAGMVTAEFAITLLAVVPVMLSLLLLTGAAAQQVQVVEAARTGARLLARGESEATAQNQIHSVLPDAQVEVERNARTVVVEVRQRIRPAGVLPEFTMVGNATTPIE